jgi:hypothetical protein
MALIQEHSTVAVTIYAVMETAEGPLIQAFSSHGEAEAFLATLE